MDPEAPLTLEKVLLFPGLHETLRSVASSALRQSGDDPSTLSRNTRSVLEQGYVRREWERRRGSIGFEIKDMDSSEYWRHPELNLRFLISLGTASPKSVRMNASKGCSWIEVSGTGSLFANQEHEVQFLIFMIDPLSTLTNPGAWLVLARGVDSHDHKTVYHNGFRAILEDEPTDGGRVLIDF